MDRILSTLHAPAPPSAQNHARVVDYENNSEHAPCASAAARPGKSFKCCKNLYSRQIDAKRPRHGYPPHPTRHPSKKAIFLLFVRVRNNKNTTHVAKFAPSLGPVSLPPASLTPRFWWIPTQLPRQANPP